MRRLLFGCIVALLLVAGLYGCEKKRGYAVVIGKEHIAAAPPIVESPSAQHTVSPNEQPRSIADDEIVVDGYVMKPEARGTSRDPRALKDEQWLVKIRMIDDGRTFNVQTEQGQFYKLKEGDRVVVRYRKGKYTGTVWDAEIQ